MARLAIHLLGSFQVSIEATPITNFESNKVRALLAYLAVESGRSQRREKLADLLWPEMSPQRTRYPRLPSPATSAAGKSGSHFG